MWKIEDIKISGDTKIRLLNKIKLENDCWKWTGAKLNTGYGYMKITHNKVKKQILAHRISYLIFNGTLGQNECVCHSCDKPDCINPDHLWKGSRAENNLDRIEKGRSKKPYTKKPLPKHCRRGHPMGDAYIYPDGSRECSSCRKLNKKRFINKRRLQKSG